MLNSSRPKASFIITILFALVFAALAAILGYKTLISPDNKILPISTDNQAAVEISDCLTREQVEKIIDDYLLKNPEIIIKSIETLHKKKVEESSAKTSEFLKENLKELEDGSNAAIMGNKQSKNTIVLFYDYTCGYCRIANTVINKAIKDGRDFKVILRPIPILGQASSVAAKAALAVSKIAPAQFLDFHNELMSLKGLNQEKIDQILNKLSIDKNEIKNEINSYSLTRQLGKNVEYAKNLGIKGAPSYIINGDFHPGLIRQEQFIEILESNKDSKEDAS